MRERPATRDDLSGVVALFCRYEEHFRGFPDSDESDVLCDWDSPGWDFAAGSLVLEDDERVVGYAVVHDGHADTVLDPDVQDPAASERLLVWAEAHPGHLEQYVPDGDEQMNARLARRGWQPARRFWRMRRELDGPLPEPGWAQGVTVRELTRPDDERAVHALITAAFRDIGGQSERAFDPWLAAMLDAPAYDPSLGLVVVDGGEVVAACLSHDVEDYGFVRQLAVAPAHRGRGLALALLHESFRRHAARGLPATVLGVDAGNRTGALQLYERAGMRVTEHFTRWDRPAPGDLGLTGNGSGHGCLGP